MYLYDLQLHELSNWPHNSTVSNSFCQVGANVRTKSLGFFAVHIGNERGATHLQMIERHIDTNVDLVG